MRGWIGRYVSFGWSLALSLAFVACSSAPQAAPTSAPAAPAPTSAPAAPAPATSAPAAAAGGGQATGTPIKIGYLADSNGTSAPIAAGMHLGTDLAVNQINANGGVNGQPIQVQYVDPQSDPTQAVQMATQLIQTDKVDVLMGAVLSSECLVVQQLVAKLQVVYLPTFGCAAEEFSSQSCNRYAFRFEPVGRQELGPLVDFITKNYGKNFAMMYSDYAYGQSQLKAYTDLLAQQGASITLPIPVPQNEPNLAPYVTKIPTDGSISGVIINGLGAGDLTRVSLALGQYGIAPKVQVIGNSGRDVYGGTYPDFLKGSVNVQTYITGQPPNNPSGDAYEKGWRDITAKEPDWANIFGGADKALGFEGYLQYTAMTALKTAMTASGFTGRADTEKLISALEKVNMPMGPDAPGGGIIMDPADHQGAQTVYVYRVSGPQQEELLATTPAEQVPQFTSCHV
ncbi:MAG: ABC transporter substrate-binding protein [Chloroflexi bacterium]|nr:ABC transporter substrate-binding protein [Chloroflexota bacterium]